ncbi:MAG TPA: nitronate monooxygenase [Blastocatellia bacterium]|nr:nitronate monooxygenase [Blastocatellia bacterium]
MLRTRFSERFGIDAPVVVAPMGPDLTGPELVAAVCNAGGFGILQAQLCAPSLLRQEINYLRTLTSRPFGVNFILHFPHHAGIQVCIEERVAALSFFWGDPSEFIPAAHAAGIAVLHQVGSVDAAVQAHRAGVDVVIAQGAEAGGHVAGQVSTMVLVPRIAEAVAPALVLAAGGIADARGLAAALCLGADGVVMGTRFLATPEANAHPAYKAGLVAAREEDTVHTILFGHGWPDAPHRVIKTPFVDEWVNRESETQDSRPDEPVIGSTIICGTPIPVQRFSSMPPNIHATGDIESMSLLAGQSVGLVREIRPAADILREMVNQADQLIRELGAKLR